MSVLKYLLLFIVAGSSLNSCLLKDYSENGNAHTNYLDDSRYVFLEFDSTHYWLFTAATPSQLNRFEQSRLDSLLKATVSQHNAQMDNPDFRIGNLATYYFQLIPVLNAQGQKEVWVNGFCRAPSENWKREVIVVQDGGNCYFNVKLNLSKRLAYDLTVNGYA